jgi:hypothetical protein
VIDKITKVACLTKIWRKFGELTMDALTLTDLSPLFFFSPSSSPLFSLFVLLQFSFSFSNARSLSLVIVFLYFFFLALLYN